MLDWHSCQICYPLEIKILLLHVEEDLQHGLLRRCRQPQNPNAKR